MKAVIPLFLLAALFLTGCPGEVEYSGRLAYDAASEAIKALPDFPAGGKLAPMRDSALFVAKSGGRVDIPCAYTDAIGNKVTRIFSAKMKRVATRWEVESAYAAPLYDDE